MVYLSENGTEDTMSEMHPKIHKLKTRPDYFNAVFDGRKKFELRYNDRNFKVGDIISLREWTGSEYTGKSIDCKIDYILERYDGLDPNYVILSISLL